MLCTSWVWFRTRVHVVRDVFINTHTQGIIDDQFTILKASMTDFAELVAFYEFAPKKKQRHAKPTPKVCISSVFLSLTSWPVV